MSKKIVIALLFFFTITEISFAKELQTINQASFSSGIAFDNKYKKQNLYSFGEYVNSNKTSLGYNFNLAKINSQWHNTDRYALFSPELFGRYKFYNQGKSSLILHNAIKMPNIYNEQKKLGLMPNKKQYDYEIRLIQLYNFHDKLVGNIVKNLSPYFFRTELAYRKKFNNPFDEINFVAIGDYKVNDKIQIMLQDNIIYNIQRNNTKHNNLFNTYGNFQINKQANNFATASIIYNYNQENALQLAYKKRIAGNNPFYDKYSIIFGIWQLF